MMCGIDEAIQHIRETCQGLPWVDRVIRRLEYHRAQANGAQPKYNEGIDLNGWYSCKNCGVRVEITWNFCPGCGYKLKWNSIRCLTGLPLVDAAERAGENQKKEE